MKAQSRDSQGWEERRAAFADGAAWFVRAVRLVAGHEHEPGLGVWSVRDLVGHTSRSLLTVEAYLDAPASRAELGSAAEYYRVAAEYEAGAGAEAVAQRGRDAGRALGADPAGAVAEIAERVLARVAVAGPDAILGTMLGAIRLADYLPTRTFELTVHTADLLAALGRAEEPPPSAARETLGVVADLAVETGRAGALLRAATGRGGLPAGYTVL
jgi:hypothetical protein